MYSAETQLCLSLHFAFSLTRTLSRSFWKCHRKEPQRSSCSSNILPQRSSCAFIMQSQRSSCGFQNSSSSNLQSAARRTSACGRKKKFLHVHYFWAVLYLKWVLYLTFNLCLLLKQHFFIKNRSFTEKYFSNKVHVMHSDWRGPGTNYVV